MLLAPLDWGLGHATRCIPIIKELDRQGARVWIAASGPQESLLRQEFPHLDFLSIPAYKIRYKRGMLLKWGLILQIPSLLRQIRKEQAWLEQTLKIHPIDLVISDNRYGLYHKSVISVLITHQLNIQSGLWVEGKSSAIWKAISRRIDHKILQFNRKFISRFTECWVPDQEGVASLGGSLSRMPVIPSTIPIRYIGWLSRFKPATATNIKNSLLILLSGPEPQRTELEQIFVRQLAGTTLNVVMVRGLPGEQIPALTIAGVEIFNHLDSTELAARISTAEFIMARSGYSTIMDLVRLQKNAILIPTPGQTEQEYLARYLHEKKWMYMVSQEKLNLENSLEDFKKTKFLQPPVYASQLNTIIEELLRKCIEWKSNSDSD